MKLTKIFFLLALSLYAACFADTTFVSGDVSGVWDTSGSPYVIVDSIRIVDTLIIDQGVEIILNGIIYNGDYDSSGYLFCNGSPTDSIYFKCNGFEISLWYYENNRFQFCVFDSVDLNSGASFNSCSFLNSKALFSSNLIHAQNSTFRNSDLSARDGACLVNCLITGDIDIYGYGSMGQPSGFAFYNCTIVGNGEITGEWFPMYPLIMEAYNSIIIGFPSLLIDWFYPETCLVIDTTDSAFLNSVFVDPLLNDFHIKDSSMAIGAGDTTYLHFVYGYPFSPFDPVDTFIIETDFDGNPRPNPAGSMPDLGCYENPLAHPAAISETPIKPTDFSLSVFPNPFNSAVRISVSPSSGSSSHLLPRQGEGIMVEIYDIAGKRVRVFENSKNIVWDGTDNFQKPLPNGIYFITDKISGKQTKAVLMK